VLAWEPEGGRFELHETGSRSARSVLAWEPEGGRFELEEC